MASGVGKVFEKLNPCNWLPEYNPLNTHNTAAATMLLGKAFLVIENSNFLNPTKYQEKRLDRQYNSIREAFEANIDNLDALFDRVDKKRTLIHRIHRPVAHVARFVVTFTVYVVIPPIGSATNATICAFTICKWGLRQVHVLSADQALKNADWQNIKNYAKGAFWDGFVSGYLLITSALAMYGEGEGRGYGFIGIFIPPFIMQFCPTEAIQFIASKELRAGLMKAIFLRQMFGIVGSDGGMAKADFAKDDESAEAGGYFFSLYVQTAMDLSLKIQQYGLSQNEVFIDDNTSESLFEIKVDTGKHRMGQDSEAKAAELIKLSKRFFFLKSFLKKMLEARENEFQFTSSQRHFQKTYEIFVPNCLKPNWNYRASGSSGASGASGASDRTTTEWQKIVQGYARGGIVKNDNRPLPFAEQPNRDKYLEFKKRVFENNTTEKSILRYDNEIDSLAETKKAFRKWTMLLHPDKIPASCNDAQKKEAEELFKLLSAAYAACLAKF